MILLHAIASPPREEIRLKTSAAVGITATQALVDAAESHPEVAANASALTVTAMHLRDVLN